MPIISNICFCISLLCVFLMWNRNTRPHRGAQMLQRSMQEWRGQDFPPVAALPFANATGTNPGGLGKLLHTPPSARVAVVTTVLCTERAVRSVARPAGRPLHSGLGRLEIARSTE